MLKSSGRFQDRHGVSGSLDAQRCIENDDDKFPFSIYKTRHETSVSRRRHVPSIEYVTTWFLHGKAAKRIGRKDDHGERGGPV